MAVESIFSFLDRQDDGLWTARYGHFTLKSAMQPIFRQKLDGALSLIGAEGLLRPYIDGLAMAPAQFFAAADLPLVENVDSMSRIIHVLNHGSLNLSDEQMIFVNFHPALLQSPEHILREIERLQICSEEIALLPSQVCCQMSVHNLPQRERLSFFADAVRRSNFKLAISHIDSGAYAMPSVFALKPDFIKLTAEWMKLGISSKAATHLLKKVLERCALLEIEPILTGIEYKAQLSFCRQLHPVHLQGHYLARPELASHDALNQLPILSKIEPMRRALRPRFMAKKLFSSAFVPSIILQKSKASLFGKRRADP